MIVPALAGLHEEEAPGKVIDHRLPAVDVPPFNGVIPLPSRRDDPIRNLPAAPARHGGRRGPFLRRKMHIAPHLRQPDTQPQPVIEKGDVAMQEVNCLPVAAMNQRVVALHRLHIGGILIQRGEVADYSPTAPSWESAHPSEICPDATGANRAPPR